MKKVIIQDLDGVSYPVKQQLLKFINNSKYKELLGTEFVNKFEESSATYPSHYLTHLKNIDNEKYLSYISKITKNVNLDKEIKKIPKKFSGNVEEKITLHLLNKFGDTNYFIEGYNVMMYALNKVLKSENMIIIGATSRGYQDNPNWIYNNCFERTNEWNKNNYDLFDKIYFKEHGKKITVLDDIKRDFGIEQNEVLCMVEDSAYELTDFLKRNIPGFLINEDKHYNDTIKQQLQKKYPKTFKVSYKHSQVKQKVLDLYEKTA